METINNKSPSGIIKDIQTPSTSSTNSNSWFGSSTNSDSTPSKQNSNFGFFSPSGKIDYMRVGMILVILLFLGINVFSYLGDFMQSVKEIFAPILKNVLESLGYVVTEGTKDITQVTAEGAKLGIDVAAGTIESGVDVIQGQLDIDQKPSNQLNKKNIQSNQSNSLNSALADAEENTIPLPDDASSSTQRNGTNKSGYCYIGEDRGFRSCIRVNENDVCMSGDIFPSKDICVNPSLRE